MRDKVIAWLQNGCSWADGLFLLPPKGYLEHFHRVCKIQGATESNKRMLQYQLCKAAGITEKEAKIIKSQAIVKAEIPTLINSNDENIKSVIELNVAKRKLDKIKLREQFPFLNDVNCPNELKILVSDKITHYYNYCEAHPKLTISSSEGDIFNASSDTVENWLLNRLIYKEFEYYQKNKKLLMKHPIFKLIKRESEIVSMTVADIFKLHSQLKMNIWRNKKWIEEEPGSEFTGERIERLKNYEFELNIVLRLLETK